MNHVERIENQDISTYFGFTEAIIDAMEKGRYVRDVVPDSAVGNHGNIICQPATDLNKPLAGRIQNVAALLSTLLQKQFSISGLELEPGVIQGDAREFGPTRYQGKGCFYFVLPEGEKIDFPKLRKDFAIAKNNLRENAPKLNPVDFSRQDAAYWVGPIKNEDDARLRKNTFHMISAFHDLPGVRWHNFTDESAKQYQVCSKADIQPLLQAEGLSSHLKID